MQQQQQGVVQLYLSLQTSHVLQQSGLTGARLQKIKYNCTDSKCGTENWQEVKRTSTNLARLKPKKDWNTGEIV